MTVNDLQRLYDYGYWANEQLLAAVSELTPEQFTRTVAGSYGSVRNTLVHMLSAEWGCSAMCRVMSICSSTTPTGTVVSAW